MLETRKKVEADLKEYPMLKRKETILEYESQHPQHVTEHEVIGALALSHSVQEMADQLVIYRTKPCGLPFNFRMKPNASTGMHLLKSPKNCSMSGGK